MTQYIQKSNCETTHLDDEWIVLNLDAFTVTKLNEVGGFCWSLLEEVHTVESLIVALEQEFQPETAIDETEIVEFLSELLECGLIINAV